MIPRFEGFSSCIKGAHKIYMERRLRASKCGIQPFKRPDEDPYCVRVTEAGQRVSAPSIKVRSTKKQERQCGIYGVGRQENCGSVEGTQCLVPTPSGGQPFSVRGG